MSTDPTPLAQRLKTRTAKVLCTDHGHAKQAGGLNCRTCARRADLAVVAVLRELIDHLRSEAPISGTAGYDEGWADAYEQVANDMEALADSIEARGTSDE